MNLRRICFTILISLVLTVIQGCREEPPPPTTPPPDPVITSALQADRLSPTPTFVQKPVTFTPALPTVSVTTSISGPSLTNMQFALDVDQSGQLVYPATEFVRGITRVYVRFGYQGFGEVADVETNWYLNENAVSAGELAWDGGDSGDYIIWIEDPNGLGRGQWRWELVADGTSLGGGEFKIGAEAGYSNQIWRLSFDPPPTWQIESEGASFVTFSSPDQRKALALRVAPGAATLSEIALAEVAVFQQDHPDADVLMQEDVTMSGEVAILQQVRYADEEDGERSLFIVSALHAGSAYSLWVLGPADNVAELKTVLAATLRSIRIATTE